MANKTASGGFKSERRRKDVLSILFVVLSVIYLIPVFLVAMNSFKSNASINLETFAFPHEGTFVSLDNYIKGLTFGDYPFLKSAGYSLLITVVSAALILLCTSMAAWYIARVGSALSAAALALKAAGGCFICHYCCTSLLRVDRSCRMLKKATSTKKITALA